MLTIFVGLLSLEGTLSSSVDGLTAKTAKVAISNFIPVVGKVLGDSIDTVLRMCIYTEKCGRTCRGNYYNRDLFNTNTEISSVNNYVSFRSSTMSAYCR